jgi:dephospho-CoA kinase
VRIIGLTGRAGAGKDTVADIIQSVAIVQRFAFADLLRFEAAEAWGIDPRLFQRRDMRGGKPTGRCTAGRSAP